MNPALPEDSPERPPYEQPYQEPYQPPPPREQLHACLLAALCSILFLGAGLLPGRALVPYPPELQAVQYAEAQVRGDLERDDLFRGKLCMGDKYNQSLAWDRIMQDRFRAGEIPRWTKDIAGGANFVPQMAQVYQPWNALLLVLPSEQWYGFWFLLHQVLIGWLAYRFFRRIGCAHESSLLGLVVVVIGMWTQCKLHHNVILTAALSLFPMLSSVHHIARCSGGARSVGWLALWTGLSWMSGFAVVSLQLSYLVVGFALLLCLANPRGQRFRPLLLCGAGMALGGVLSSAHMLPVLLAAGESARATPSSDGLVARSLEWGYLLTVLWPDLLHWSQDWFHAPPHMFRPPLATVALFHDSVTNTGFNFVECSFAVGIPAFAVGLFALGDRQRRPLVLYFALATLFAFALATATFPAFHLAHLLPGLCATDLKRNLYLVAVGLAVLVALGADRVLATGPPRWGVIFLAFVTTVSAALATWMFLTDDLGLIDAIAWLISLDSGHKWTVLADGDAGAIAAGMKDVMQGGFADEPLANLIQLRTTFLRATLVAGAALATLLVLRGRARLWMLIGLTALELLHAGHGPAVAVDAGRVSTPPAVVAPVLEAETEAPGVRPRFQRLGPPDVEGESVFSLYPPNLAGFHHLEDVACYNPLPPARMEQFFLALEPDEPGPPGQRPKKKSVVFVGAGVSWFRRERSLLHPLADLLGIRFVLSSRTVDLPGIEDRTPAGAAPPFRLYERTTCLPRATFVRSVRILPDPTERLAELTRADRDVASELILEDPAAPVPPAANGAATPAEVEIVDHRDEIVRVRVRNGTPGYLRLADPYDPGWTVTVDGEPATLYVADHYLRAVHLPAGEHEVAFSFDGPRVLWPLRISMLALVAVVVLLLWRRRQASPEA